MYHTKMRLAAGGNTALGPATELTGGTTTIAKKEKVEKRKRGKGKTVKWRERINFTL